MNIISVLLFSLQHISGIYAACGFSANTNVIPPYLEPKLIQGAHCTPNWSTNANTVHVHGYLCRFHRLCHFTNSCKRILHIKCCRNSISSSISWTLSSKWFYNRFCNMGVPWSNSEPFNSWWSSDNGNSSANVTPTEHRLGVYFIIRLVLLISSRTNPTDQSENI